MWKKVAAAESEMFLVTSVGWERDSKGVETRSFASLHHASTLDEKRPALSTCSLVGFWQHTTIHEISLNHVRATWFLGTKRRLLCQTIHIMPEFSSQC